jgi:hypothetical protein
MAITKTIEIDVNSLKAVGGLENLDKALKQVDKSAKSVDATFEEVYGDLQPLTSRMGEAEDRLYELALAGQSATKEYQDLLQTVGNYRKVQMQTDMVVDAAATTFDAKLGGALQGVTSTFAGVQGAMALTGGESQKLEEALIKVQGAMALAEGVRGIREGAVAFKALGISARIALNGIKTGIAATGVGVLLIALGAIVAYWDDIKELVGGVSSEQEKLNAQAQANLDLQQGKLDAIGGQENILKLQGKSEKDILKLKIAQTDEVIKATENQIAQNDITAKAQIAASQRNRDILAGIIKFIQTPLTLLLEGVDMVGKALGQNFGLAQGFSDLVDKGASLIFDPEAEKKKAEETRKESLKGLEKLKNDRAGLQLSIKNIDEQAAKDAAAKQKEKNDKELEAAKAQKEALKNIEQNALKDIENLKAKTEVEKVALQKQRDLAELDALKLTEEEKAKARLAILEKYKILEGEAKVKDAETKKKEDDEKLAKDQEAKIKELELKKEFDKLTFDEQRNILTEKENALLNDETLTEEQRTTLKQQYADARIKIDELEAQAKEKMVAAIGQTLATASELLGKNTVAGKAMAIAATTVDTLQSSMSAYKGMVAAIPGPAGIVAGGVAAAGAIATGLATVKKIVSVKVPSGGGGGGSAPSVSAAGGGGGGAAPAPSFNVVGNSGVNQIAQTLGNQQPVQAYVVANNVTTQQSLDRNIVSNASLG